jgi:hypothetical protein
MLDKQQPILEIGKRIPHSHHPILDICKRHTYPQHHSVPQQPHLLFPFTPQHRYAVNPFPLSYPTYTQAPPANVLFAESMENNECGNKNSSFVPPANVLFAESMTTQPKKWSPSQLQEISSKTGVYTHTRKMNDQLQTKLINNCQTVLSNHILNLNY